MRITTLLAASAALAGAVASTASAATMSYTPAPSGNYGDVLYAAAAGEANHPVITTPEGDLRRRVALISDTVPVTAGPGCLTGPPLTCGELNTTSVITVRLGDGDDSGDAGSNLSNTYIYGDGGADDVRSGGLVAYGEGGSGNDRVRVYGLYLSEGHGGSGDDTVWVRPLAPVKLYGDSGDDLIGIAGNGASDIADGGTGDDRIVTTGYPPSPMGMITGMGGTLTGGAGDDILATQLDHPARGPIDGGSGNDTLSVPAGPTTADGGSGNDLIDTVDRHYVPNNPYFRDDVTCGSGTDEVWADPADVVAADCEVVHVTTTGPTLPGVAAAVAAANALYP